FTLFAEYVETQSRLFAANLADPAINTHHITMKSPALDDSNSIVSINGYAFGNMPMIHLKRGEHVRWYVLATMSEFDFHAPDWHGETVMSDGNRTNVIQLGPMDMKAVDMWPDNPGTWLFNCDINVHRMAGMTARYTVQP
ncbi:MAG TPA: multicopper oxidase domain-containing protein, partial [Candidatus Eremiobacteraceae bacterium]|nr:multicopper oxidase domain-containing protein [Candidatus Eremiobacteraceae bacterium]